MVLKLDNKTLSRKTDKTNELAIAWDFKLLDNVRNQLFIEFSSDEWSSIVEKLNNVKLEFPVLSSRNQGDPAIHKKLVLLLKEFFPELIRKFSVVPSLLESKYRFCVVKGLRFQELEQASRDFLILSISSFIGLPTMTDKVNKIVLWPVKPEEKSTVSNTTFSQRTGEAAYHTDTQYFENPERYMSLWCINPDKDGGGVSGLVDGRKVIEEIQRKYGEDTIKTLSDPVYPFRVPSVFTAKGGDENTEVYYGAIINLNELNKPLIRYRKETLDKGMRASGFILNTAQERALSLLEEVLNDKKLEFAYLLREGDVMFANNHELLHNRSHFEDMERFLIRVRFNPKIEQS